MYNYKFVFNFSGIISEWKNSIVKLPGRCNRNL